MLKGIHIDKINKRLNEALIRRLLVRYFCERGFSENFDRKLYPPAIQDITIAVPELQSRVEIVPYMEEVDPQTGYGRVGWNMFVNGNQRLFLGETEHPNMSDFARKIEEAAQGVVDLTEDISPSNRETTPRRVVNFITRILTNSEHGVRHTSSGTQAVATPRGRGATMTGHDMFQKNQPIRPE